MAGISSKEAQAHLIDPMNEPDPASETGPGSHFGSTFAPKQPTTTTTEASPRSSLGSRNPFRDNSIDEKSPTTKTTESFPNYRGEAFSDYPKDAPRRSGSSAGSRGTPPRYTDHAVAGASSSGGAGGRGRRSSSLKERFPGDDSNKPLDVIRRGSKKADRSPHLNKRHIPGADVIDRLDPALGGRAYHHEGPYDAAMLSRNTDARTAPIAALESSNQEALKATPKENIKDALEKHKPLDGVAVVPPGVPDQFGRTYQYEEGTDMMREGTGDAGYKRWPGKEYDPEDYKGQSEPTFSLDRALQAHKIDDNGIEMEDRAHINKDYHRAERKGTLDTRDPVEIAGDEGKYAELEHAAMARDNDADLRRSGSMRHAGESLKRRIGSLRHRNRDD